jgi:CRP/FNR family transcriptional regulator
LNALLNLVTARLRKLATLANDLAFKDVSARVCHVLLEQAVGGDSSLPHLKLERPLTRQELAAMVGTAREVAWRALKKLENDGLIEIHGQNIVILDAAALALRA